MKILGIFLVALFALTGCASTSDVKALQAQVSALESNDKVVNSEITELKAKVAACEVKHAECEKHCKALTSKLDRVFKKAQMK